MLLEVKEAVSQVLNSGSLERVKTAIQKASTVLEEDAAALAEGKVGEKGDASIRLAETLLDEVNAHHVLATQLETIHAQLTDPVHWSAPAESWVTFAATSRTPSPADRKRETGRVGALTALPSPPFVPGFAQSAPQGATPSTPESSCSDSPPQSEPPQEDGPRLPLFQAQWPNTASLGTLSSHASNAGSHIGGNAAPEPPFVAQWPHSGSRSASPPWSHAQMAQPYPANAHPCAGGPVFCARSQAGSRSASPPWSHAHVAHPTSVDGQPSAARPLFRAQRSQAGSRSASPPRSHTHMATSHPSIGEPFFGAQGTLARSRSVSPPRSHATMARPCPVDVGQPSIADQLLHVQKSLAVSRSASPPWIHSHMARAGHDHTRSPSPVYTSRLRWAAPPFTPCVSQASHPRDQGVATMQSGLYDPGLTGAGPPQRGANQTAPNRAGIRVRFPTSPAAKPVLPSSIGENESAVSETRAPASPTTRPVVTPPRIPTNPSAQPVVPPPPIGVKEPQVSGLRVLASPVPTLPAVAPPTMGAKESTDVTATSPSRLHSAPATQPSDHFTPQTSLRECLPKANCGDWRLAQLGSSANPSLRDANKPGGEDSGTTQLGISAESVLTDVSDRCPTPSFGPNRGESPQAGGPEIPPMDAPSPLQQSRELLDPCLRTPSVSTLEPVASVSHLPPRLTPASSVASSGGNALHEAPRESPQLSTSASTAPVFMAKPVSPVPSNDRPTRVPTSTGPSMSPSPAVYPRVLPPTPECQSPAIPQGWCQASPAPRPLAYCQSRSTVDLHEEARPLSRALSMESLPHIPFSELIAPRAPTCLGQRHHSPMTRTHALSTQGSPSPEPCLERKPVVRDLTAWGRSEKPAPAEACCTEAHGVVSRRVPVSRRVVGQPTQFVQAQQVTQGSLAQMPEVTEQRSGTLLDERGRGRTLGIASQFRQPFVNGGIHARHQLPTRVWPNFALNGFGFIPATLQAPSVAGYSSLNSSFNRY